MKPNVLLTLFGGVTFFAALHAAGGVIGAIVGIVVIKALTTRVNLAKV
jgi:hypothetical protein